LWILVCNARQLTNGGSAQVSFNTKNAQVMRG
jgi:hypothetical protein